MNYPLINKFGAFNAHVTGTISSIYAAAFGNKKKAGGIIEAEGQTESYFAINEKFKFTELAYRNAAHLITLLFSSDPLFSRPNHWCFKGSEHTRHTVYHYVDKHNFNPPEDPAQEENVPARKAVPPVCVTLKSSLSSVDIFTVHRQNAGGVLARKFRLTSRVMGAAMFEFAVRKTSFQQVFAGRSEHFEVLMPLIGLEFLNTQDKSLDELKSIGIRMGLDNMNRYSVQTSLAKKIDTTREPTAGARIP